MLKRKNRRECFRAACIPPVLLLTCISSNGCYPSVPKNSSVPVAEVSNKTAANEEALTKTEGMMSQDAFFRAINIGDSASVQRGLRQGIDVNVLDPEGHTPLMLASFEGHASMVDVLIQAGAKIDQRDSMQRTALFYAASGTNVESVDSLLRAGADVNVKDGQEGWTPIMVAASEGHPAVVQKLLEKNPELLLRDVDGDSALDFAVQKGHREVVELLKAKIENLPSSTVPTPSEAK
jgi:uncharacterized protein